MLKAFTLIETLVAGVIISMLAGIATLIFLNVSGSLGKTNDVLAEEFIHSQLDSLAQIKKEYDISLGNFKGLNAVASKKKYNDAEWVYEVVLQLLDSTDHIKYQGKRLIYEAY